MNDVPRLTRPEDDVQAFVRDRRVRRALGVARAFGTACPTGLGSLSGDPSSRASRGTWERAVFGAWRARSCSCLPVVGPLLLFRAVSWDFVPGFAIGSGGVDSRLRAWIGDLGCGLRVGVRTGEEGREGEGGEDDGAPHSSGAPLDVRAEWVVLGP